LCEKPIALDAKEAALLVAEAKKYPDLKVMEAFMYRFHPQWKKVKELVKQETIGEVKAIQSFFSYFNNNPLNIRNQSDIGGGALMDIGCYCIQFPRFILETEPVRVMAFIDRDPQMKIDRSTTAMLDFGNGVSSSFTCSTQMQSIQRAHIVGTKGRIEIEIPVNAPPDRLLKVSLFTHDLSSEMFIGPADQYTLQAEAFALAVLENKPVPTPLEDALANMKVIDALFDSEKQGAWLNL
jgi:predicted dehydrogenase